MYRNLPALFFIVGAMPMPVHGQFFERLFNPDVVVTLTHPPTLGLKVKRVAFAPTRGEVAEDLISACIEDLSASGELEILDSHNIRKVMREMRLGSSSLADPATAMKMGQMMGSPILLVVKVQRSEIKQIPLKKTSEAWTDKKGVQHPSVTTHTSKTQLEFNASVQTIDLATGRIYNQQRIMTTPFKENVSDKGRPEFPSDTEVMEMAIHHARTEVRRMLLSWTEKKKLIFYDDKDYGMKEAYRRLQADDAPDALRKSMDALSAAKADAGAKSKYVGRSHYNVGMCHFILGDVNQAMVFLKAARDIDSENSIYREAMEECARGLNLQEEMNRVDARSDQIFELDLAQEPAGQPLISDRTTLTKPSETPEQRLNKLDDLRRKELITPEEYKKKREKILNDL
jgi:hypothetical protein